MMISMTSTRMTAEINRQSLLGSAVARTQIEISTGKKIQQASDDPVASARVAALRTARSNNTSWQANLSYAQGLTDQADSVMRTVSQQMIRAQELMVSAASGSLSTENRATVALELRSIAVALDALASTHTADGNPLFATGPALQMRFSETEVFAPVPSRIEMFDVGGRTLGQLVSDAANAVQTGGAASMAQSLTDLQAGLSRSADGAAEIGVLAKRVDSIRERLIDQDIAIEVERSGLEDTDLSEAIARLNQQTITLDAARAAFARINRQTLFDLLS
jgi:flagellar hook-associated protein 3 FlgL